MKILFLCHGNINRSAAGEIIVKQKYPEHEVKSAGLKTKGGGITAKKMRDALQELGYENNSIRSTMVTKELVDWADVIFYMDYSNEKNLEEQFGVAVFSKATRISKLLGIDKIPDPNYEKTNDLHKHVIKLLEMALDRYFQ